ncbi:hypothetical protein QCN27_18275 [Cereibacter sp. SYSU M97828]|nr:hypothetical protein [Cereibacter flavus]
MDLKTGQPCEDFGTNGAVDLWEDVLPNGGQANPISYKVDGEQYVLIGASSHAFMETGCGDEIVAYRLAN